MTHHIIYRGANRFWEMSIAQRGRVGIVSDYFMVNHAVYFFCSDANLKDYNVKLVLN